MGDDRTIHSQTTLGPPDDFRGAELGRAGGFPDGEGGRIAHPRHYLVPYTGEPIPLRPWRVLILGRGTDCHVILESPGVSRRHAALRGASDRFLIEDLGSANGTWLNGHRIERSVLEDGDFVTLGTASFAFIATTRHQLPVRVREARLTLETAGADARPRPGGWTDPGPPRG